MFGFIRRMFGEGKIRAEVTFVDGSKGFVKVAYTGDPSTLDYKEFEKNVKNVVFVEYGRVVKHVKIVGMY